MCLPMQDPEGVARAAVSKQAAAAGGHEALNSVLRVLRKALVRQPAVQTGDAGGEVYISAELKKALQAAAKLQKKKGDSFLGAYGPCGGGGLLEQQSTSSSVSCSQQPSPLAVRFSRSPITQPYAAASACRCRRAVPRHP